MVLKTATATGFDSRQVHSTFLSLSLEVKMDLVKREFVEEMAECLSRLHPEEKQNLWWHCVKGTPICCGKNANKWTDGEGGG